MSLVPIFGHFYSNKNMAIEIAQFLKPQDLARMVVLNKKCKEAYS
jgi:hypothetical protein